MADHRCGYQMGPAHIVGIRGVAPVDGTGVPKEQKFRTELVGVREIDSTWNISFPIVDKNSLCLSRAALLPCPTSSLSRSPIRGSSLGATPHARPPPAQRPEAPSSVTGVGILTTTRCAVLFKRLQGISMVSSAFVTYRGAFLFALSVHRDVGVAKYNFSPE